MVDSMRKCIEEVKAVEARQKEQGLANMERSRNQICKEFGIHPSTLSKWMTGKVVGMAPSLGEWGEEGFWLQVSFNWHSNC